MVSARRTRPLRGWCRRVRHRGVQEFLRPEAATDFVVGYVVLAVSFALEGISFLRSVRQAKHTAELMHRDLIEQVIRAVLSLSAPDEPSLAV